MILPLLKMTIVIAVGHALAAASYWWLLNTPESTVFMLGVSASAVVLGLGFVALSAGTALLWQREGAPFAGALRRGAKVIPAFVLALALVALLILLTRLGELWWSEHRGEIDAWFIATFGLADVGWLHRGVAILMRLLRWVLGASIAAALLAAGAAEGARGLIRLRWLWQACGLRRLLLVLAVLAILVWLPWQVIHWRPPALPPNWLELAFTGAKLALFYLLLSLAWAVLLLRAARARGL